MTGNFKKGDSVTLIDTTGKYTVVAEKGDQIILEDEWGMEMMYPADAVISQIQNFAYTYPSEEDALAKEQKQRLNLSKPAIRKQSNQSNNDIWEIDLHLSALHPNSATQNKSYQHALAGQLSAFRSFLKKAIAERHANLVVIHGDGDGVLKNEVHLILLQMDNLIFNAADPDIYGTGATSIQLKFDLF